MRGTYKSVFIGKIIRLFFCLLIVITVCGAGAGAEETVVMSLDDCIKAALVRNPSIEIQKIDLINTEKSVTAEESKFDPEFAAGFSYADSRRPTSSVVTGNRRKTAEFSLGYGSAIENGDSYELSLSQVRADADSNSSSLNPAYTIDLGLTYTRPLRQGRGKEVTLSRLKISRLNTGLSELELESEVMEAVYKVETAYWNLVYAIENLKVREESQRLARGTLERTRAMVEAGAMAESQTLLVESQLAARDEEVISAAGEVEKAALGLKEAMNVGADSELWETRIAPGGPGVEAAAALPDFTGGLETALANRPDYLGAAAALEISALETFAARDRTKPSVDFETTVGLGGLKDKYSGSVQDITSLENPSWEAGIWLELPVGRREAKATLEQRLGKEEQARLRMEKIRQSVAVEVAQAEVKLNTARNKTGAAAVTRKYAEEKLKEEEEKHVLGIATTHDVLEYQEDLAVAKLNESKAVIDYNRALTEYYYILGTLLEQKKIEVAAEQF